LWHIGTLLNSSISTNGLIRPPLLSINSIFKCMKLRAMKEPTFACVIGWHSTPGRHTPKLTHSSWAVSSWPFGRTGYATEILNPHPFCHPCHHPLYTSITFNKCNKISVRNAVRGQEQITALRSWIYRLSMQQTRSHVLFCNGAF
jgi:hypothetical protein